MSTPVENPSPLSPTGQNAFGMVAVAVAATMLWVDPSSPRDVDGPAVADEPDLTAWLEALDAHPDDDETGNGRLGLHGRVESQLVRDEPAFVDRFSPDGTWAHIRAPWQPSPLPLGARIPGSIEPGNDHGWAAYPGWVPTTHLMSTDEPAGQPEQTGSTVQDVLDFARAHVGLRYLWGGTTPAGFDCSGLVHQAWRRLGLVVPRDAWAQAVAAESVDIDAVQPGDLYFFAHPGQRIHHVGIVTAPGRMVHASETGGVLVEEDLPRARLETLVSAGRFRSPATP